MFKILYIATNLPTGEISGIASVAGKKSREELELFLNINGLYGLYYIPDSCVKKITGNIGWEGVIYSMDFKK